MLGKGASIHAGKGDADRFLAILADPDNCPRPLKSAGRRPP